MTLVNFTRPQSWPRLSSAISKPGDQVERPLSHRQIAGEQEQDTVKAQNNHGWTNFFALTGGTVSGHVLSINTLCHRTPNLASAAGRWTSAINGSVTTNLLQLTHCQETLWISNYDVLHFAQPSHWRKDLTLPPLL